MDALDAIEKIAISFAISIALVSVGGLILYYSPFHLTLNATVVTLFVVTSALATAGWFKENRISKDNKPLDDLPFLDDYIEES